GVHRESSLLTRLPDVGDELLPVELLASSVALHDLKTECDALVGAEALPARRTLPPPADALSSLDITRIDDSRVLVAAEWAPHACPSLMSMCRIIGQILYPVLEACPDVEPLPF